MDAAIIDAPGSTKNADHARYPEMHQTKKGNEWRFGMKIHVGVYAGTGAVVSVEAKAANVHDVTMACKLLREDDTAAYWDSGYPGIERRPEIIEDEHLSRIKYRINRRPGKLHRMKDNGGQNPECHIEKRKSSVRSKVEHQFRFLKVQCGFRKTVYRGLMKNLNCVFVLFAVSNLYSLSKAGCRLAVNWE